MRYKNILVIDDDADDRELFLLALEQLSNDFVFHEMASAEKALPILMSGELLPDVIFLDLNMPIMSGQQFLTELKKYETLKRIPIIIFSTTSHKPTIALTKELGAEEFITKPAGFFELVDALKHVLTNRKI